MTEADYITACRAFWAWQGLGWSGSMIASGGVAVCWLGLLGLGGVPVFGWILIGAACVPPGLLAWRDWNWRRYFRTYHAANGPFTLGLTEADVTTTSQLTSQTLSWAFYRHHLATDTHLYLVRDQRVFSILPRRSFADVGGWDDACALARQNLPPLPRRRI